MKQTLADKIMLYAVHIGENDAVMVFGADVRSALKQALDVEPVYMLHDPLNIVVLDVTVNCEVAP